MFMVNNCPCFGSPGTVVINDRAWVGCIPGKEDVYAQNHRCPDCGTEYRAASPEEAALFDREGDLK